MKTFFEFINENNINVFKKISNNLYLVDFLINLIHEKSHIITQKGKYNELNKVFKFVKNEVCKFNLYRGLYPQEIKDFKVGEKIKLDRYTSFSENIKIAETFSEKK